MGDFSSVNLGLVVCSPALNMADMSLADWGAFQQSEDPLRDRHTMAGTVSIEPVNPVIIHGM